MVLRTVRVGDNIDVAQYDDGDHATAMDTDGQPIAIGQSAAGTHAIRQDELPALGNVVSSSANITDHAVVRGDGGAKKVQDSLVTINDAGSISLPALQTIDGVDISVHAANVDAHHAQVHDAASHSDIASSGANIDDAVTKRHSQGSDTALGVLGTKNPPVDADLVVQRDSASAFALVTSTWTQIKAFLKSYFDTLYGPPIATDPIWDAAGDTVYGTGANTAAKLAAGAANLKKFMNAAGTAPEWANGIKVGTFTRDMAAASGNVGYTGVGFKPSCILLVGGITGTYVYTIGLSDGTNLNVAYYTAADTIAIHGDTYIIAAYPSGAGQLGALAAMGADGFTLTWTKDGNPTGTLRGNYVAFR